MKAATSAGRLLTAKDAAHYLGVPYTTLRDWAHRGILPVVRVPECRRWWIDRHDLDRVVERFKEICQSERRSYGDMLGLLLDVWDGDVEKMV